MDFFKKHKVAIICLGALIIMIAGVFFWNKIALLQKQDKEEDNNNSVPVDVSDANNIPSVEEKLGSDMKITQGYLLNYTRNKSSVWYMSSAKVKKIAKDGSFSIITLSGDTGSKTLKATIESSKVDIKKGDKVNFVGTVNLDEGSIELSKISKDDIDYNSVTEILFDDLVENIKLIKSTYFIVNGYMVTEGDVYKLYESKDTYKKNKSAGNSFLISWKDDFGLTGNALVTIKCLLDDTYKLNECVLIEN